MPKKAMTLLVQLKDIPVVGASGAVFGVLLAFGMMFPNQPLYIYFLIPVKAKYVVIGYGLLEVYFSFSQPGSGIAHVAHIGGMIFGFILIKYWNRKKSNFY
jgi:membrane associated rhomboid family serine protease